MFLNNPGTDDLLNCLKDDYGLTAPSLDIISGGADLEAKTYKALSNGQYFLVKIKKGPLQKDSTYVPAYLAEQGITCVIPPLKTLQGHFQQDVSEWTLTVTPFIDGRDGFNCSLSSAQWKKLGANLKQIHSLDIPSGMVPNETFGARWYDRVRSLYDLIESEPRGDDLAIAFHKFLKTHLDEIKALVNQAQRLAQKIENQSNPFVLCHADLHAGNILIDTNDDLYIIDWEAPILAPKERDLMFIGACVGNVWNKAEEAKWFFQGYGDVDINPDLIAYYRSERILEDTAIYTHQILQSTDNDKTREQSFNHFTAQFEPNGVVEIAMRTL